jgi:hypothetical protein
MGRTCLALRTGYGLRGHNDIFVNLSVTLIVCAMVSIAGCEESTHRASAIVHEGSASSAKNIIADEVQVTGQLFESFQRDVVVTAVEFEITPDGVRLLTIDSERSGIRLNAELIRTEDPKLLELVKTAFDARYCYHQFRELDTDGNWGAGSLGQPYGKLRIITNQGLREFGVSRYGFSRSNGPAGVKHGFVSATACEFVNVLFSRRHSYSMPPLLLDGLSGERQLSEDRRLFQGMREARGTEQVD